MTVELRSQCGGNLGIDWELFAHVSSAHETFEFSFYRNLRNCKSAMSVIEHLEKILENASIHFPMVFNGALDVFVNLANNRPEADYILNHVRIANFRE